MFGEQVDIRRIEFRTGRLMVDGRRRREEIEACRSSTKWNQNVCSMSIIPVCLVCSWDSCMRIVADSTGSADSTGCAALPWEHNSTKASAACSSLFIFGIQELITQKSATAKDYKGKRKYQNGGILYLPSLLSSQGQCVGAWTRLLAIRSQQQIAKIIWNIIPELNGFCFVLWRSD